MSNPNLIELTEPLIRDGVEYPAGTICTMVGMMSEVKNSPVYIGIMLENGQCIQVTDNVKNCTDFKYKELL